MMNGQNTWRRLVINMVATIDKRWLRYVVPSLIAIYTLSLVGWLVWAMPQVGRVKVAAILPHNPNFLAVIIGALILHLIITWVLLALMIRRRRFATLLLGAWFIVPAPVILVLLFISNGVASYALMSGCGGLSLLVMRYYENQVPHAGTPEVLIVSNGRKWMVLGGGVLLSLAVSFVGPRGMTWAEPIILLAVLLVWVETDVLILVAQAISYFVSIALFLMGWSFSSRVPDWYYVFMGCAWLGVLLFWGLVAMAIRRWVFRRGGNLAAPKLP